MTDKDIRAKLLWKIMGLLYEVRYRTPTSDIEGWSLIARMQTDCHKVIKHYEDKYENNEH